MAHTPLTLHTLTDEHRKQFRNGYNDRFLTGKKERRDAAKLAVFVVILDPPDNTTHKLGSAQYLAFKEKGRWIPLVMDIPEALRTDTKALLGLAAREVEQHIGTLPLRGMPVKIPETFEMPQQGRIAPEIFQYRPVALFYSSEQPLNLDRQAIRGFRHISDWKPCAGSEYAPVIATFAQILASYKWIMRASPHQSEKLGMIDFSANRVTAENAVSPAMI